MTNFIQLVKWTSNLSALPAVITGRLSRGLLWYYACFSLLADLAGYVLRNGFSMKTYFVSNPFLLAEFLLVGSYLLRSVWRKITGLQLLILLSVPAAYFILQTLRHHPDSTNLEDSALLAGLLIILCLAALYRVMARIEHLRLEQSPLFTFASAFLLYAAGTMLLVLFDDYLTDHFKETINKIWLIHDCLNILKNAALARALYLTQKADRAFHR